VLAFATCSVLREEGEEVTEALCAEGGLEPVLPETMVDSALFPPPSAPQANFRLLPHSHGTDGYFVARLQRKSFFPWLAKGTPSTYTRTAMASTAMIDRFRGVFTALVTPMSDDARSIDRDAFEALVERQLDA